MRQRASGVPGIPFKGPMPGLTQTYSLILSSRAGAAAQKMPESYREELNCLPLGLGSEEQLSPR